MSKDYSQRFQTVLSDTTIDDLLKETVGYHEAIESIQQVNEWVQQNIKPDADFREDSWIQTISHPPINQAPLRHKK
jgi:PhoPQ-activated pathogenicity-related protein